MFSPPVMPRREVGSTLGATKEKPKRWGCQLTSSYKSGNQSGSQKQAAGKGTSSDKKKKKNTKGEKGAQGKQANQKTRFTCRKQKLRARRTQPLTKQERKEAKSDSNHMPSFSGPCLPSCTMQGNMLSNYFVNAKLWVVLETFLRRRKFNLIPFLKC